MLVRAIVLMIMSLKCALFLCVWFLKFQLKRFWVKHITELFFFPLNSQENM